METKKVFTKLGKKLSFILVIALIMLLPMNALAETKLNQTNVDLRVGQTYQLKMTGTEKKVVWNSSNSKVVTVSNTGNMKGIAKGAATITASVSGKKYPVKVNVVSKISVNDFKSESKEKGTTKKSDFVSESKKWNYSYQYFTGNEDCKTNRGITLGASASEIKSLYGLTAYQGFDCREVAYTNFTYSASNVNWRNEKKWENFLEYKLIDKGIDYRMRFYLKNNKVDTIVFLKNFELWQPSKTNVTVKYSETLRTEKINGKTVTILPKGATFKFNIPLNYAHNVTLDMHKKDGSLMAFTELGDMVETKDGKFNIDASVKKLYLCDTWGEWIEKSGKPVKFNSSMLDDYGYFEIVLEDVDSGDGSKDMGRFCFKYE